ncbi:glycosyltransferase [Vibrio sp. YMD68]|uniref:glycosyltransferase n=1 Tax=Vibrio sp. YMD68 TaxID=3042300 RepID=UPI00249A20C6|nr:glycosyltransferase [Vibrio sp. YMD68]WGW00524.1 glycosyltransferase [Vibrio sp. YMD68]
MKKIAFVTSNSLSAKVFLSPHLKYLSSKYEVTLISNFDGVDMSDFNNTGIAHFKHVPISRDISLLRDPVAFAILWWHFIIHRYHSVHSITPKAGLLGMLAAKLSFVPRRFHTFTGQVWVTKTGVFRALLKQLDGLIAASTTVTLADSPSQAEFLFSEGVTRSEPEVLARGSISGVDTKRFIFNPASRKEIRQLLGIKEIDVLFLFLGRLCQDKGIDELISAFGELSKQDKRAHLLLVGPNEEKYDELFFNHLNNSNVHRVGFTTNPEDYYSVSDIFVLPSYREGFGTSVLEAAAAGLPAIASSIYGLSDAIEDKKTGVLVAAKDDLALYNVMREMVANEELRHNMGLAAYKRSCTDFAQQRVVEAMLDFYLEQEDK